MTPYLSIVIPLYNRERFIARAINSCLKQDFEKFEIIVVDDCSKDKSVDVVKSFTDARIKLLYHNVNRGVGPTRNTGVSKASGEWIICLDSDDELLPGSLNIIDKRSREVDKSISRLEFMVKYDTGELSPYPPLMNEFWDYIRYVQWLESSYNHLSETFPIVRRVTFEKVRYYNDRTLEFPYHLDFMKQFNAWSFADAVRLYHHDAENQLTKPSMSRTIEGAQNQALSGDLLLENHSKALKKHAPKIYRRYISGLSTLYFLSGNRMKGTKYSFSSLACNCFSVRYWVILLLGLLGPKPLAYFKTFRARHVYLS